MSSEEEVEVQQNISFGAIMTVDSFNNNVLFPDQLKKAIKESDFYLLVFVPGSEQAKINIFPIQSPSVRKILVHLKNFSPTLVRGISEVLKELKLNNNLIHTTGLCFSDKRGCYYETYVDFHNLRELGLNESNIKEKFMSLSKVQDVCILHVSSEACSDD